MSGWSHEVAAEYGENGQGHRTSSQGHESSNNFSLAALVLVDFRKAPEYQIHQNIHIIVLKSHKLYIKWHRSQIKTIPCCHLSWPREGGS